MSITQGAHLRDLGCVLRFVNSIVLNKIREVFLFKSNVGLLF